MANLEALLHEAGLAITGHFAPEPEDFLPAETLRLALIGADGGRMWEIFSASDEARDGAPHPLDRWSERVLTRIAAKTGAEALFPFGGPPWQPFIRWAARGEGARPSPVTMQVSPRRGLWMSYRGALGFRTDRELGPVERRDPCVGCPAPCLTACPVNAFANGGYDVPACTAHVTSDAGVACRSGCLVRHACPVGEAPPIEQREYHMQVFLAAHSTG
ncbi:ferredoxin [Rhodobacteraceae bacterium NNCM2]|nr:ferredoxin [Coraliihabitans acroporae]